MTLVVEGMNLDPGSVTERLGSDPTRSAAPGEDSQIPDGAGFWGLDFGMGFSAEFHRQLSGALDFAEQRAGQLSSLQAAGHDVRLAVYGFSGNESKLPLSPEELGRLAGLGLPFRITPNLNQR
ncbi:DUF4279 domain-containing protein [Streptomyces albidus (ex Kaewkla and Franco 2022)]|uniref:DUF4279 domain-containing protein n=1 Tax=Streptomyces albidus (ex Kaewkla and Franco 2022) TaxID=722709 RepID=UPI0015EFBBBA|nr:DUF4279 domain-containing protein [Streptomyces albidus (ex Kaewkla and Franco 2022)]